VLSQRTYGRKNQLVKPAVIEQLQASPLRGGQHCRAPGGARKLWGVQKMLCSKALVRLFQGTIFAAAVMVAPSAIAHGSHYGHGARQVAPHHQHRFAGHHRHYASLTLRHRSYRVAATGSEASVMAARYEPAPGEAHPERARLYRADYDALEERRLRVMSDERERPVTVQLNLAQLRIGRERDEEIARWKQEYAGGAASG
jgi:hypothetical protein